MYECEFCNKEFKNQQKFEDHTCKYKLRHEAIKTVLGQIAYHVYNKWNTIRGFGERSVDDFIHARTFLHFCKFATFLKKIKGLPDIDEFIKFTIKYDLPPNMWVDNRVYQIYLEYMDKQTTIKDKVQITLDTLCKYCDEYNCNLQDIFQYVNPNTIIKHIRERKLTPWVLLNSKKFLQYIGEQDENIQYTFDELISAEYWYNLFKNNPKDVKFVKKCIDAANL